MQLRSTYEFIVFKQKIDRERKKERDRKRIKPNNACREMFECVTNTSLWDIVNARGCTYVTEVASNAFSRVLSRVTSICYIFTDME